MWQRLDRMSGQRRLRHRDADRDQAILPDTSLPPGTDRIPQIRHIVLLMMENRSFNNYLGTLSHGDGLPSPLPVNRRRDGTPVPAHRFATTKQMEHVPSQSWHASHPQFDQGRNDGFVTSIQGIAANADVTVGMGYWSTRDPAASLQQPVRIVGALAQLRDRYIQGAGAGVELAVPVAVAHVRALG
jgi:phospholipase C